MKTALRCWQFCGMLSAIFAALTAVFAKLGVAQIHPDYATLIRTIVVVCVLALIVAAERPLCVSRPRSSRAPGCFHPVGPGHGRVVAVLFPGAAIGRSRASRRSTSSASCWSLCSARFPWARNSSGLNWLGVALMGARASAWPVSGTVRLSAPGRDIGRSAACRWPRPCDSTCCRNRRRRRCPRCRGR